MKRRKTWTRLFDRTPSDAPGRKAKRPGSTRNALQVEQLESWIAPASMTLGGLFFDAPAGDLGSNPVTVTVANENTPLLRFAGGVTFSGSTFTPIGKVSGVGATDVQLLNGTTHPAMAPADLLGAGVTIPAASSAGVALTVPSTGTQVTATKLRIVGNAGSRSVGVGGDAGFTAINGLTGDLGLPLPSNILVQIDAGGVRYNGGFSAKLPIGKTFNFKKLDLTVDDVTVGYDNINKTFTLDGGVSVTTKGTANLLKSASAKFGDGTNPGFKIESGKVTGVNIAVNAAFSLYGVNVSADNLKINYDANDDALELSGGLNVALTEKIGFAAALNEPIAIDTTTGDLSLPNGLDISGSVKFGGIGADANIKYKGTPGNYSVQASVLVHLNQFDVGGTFTFVNGNVTAVGLSYDAANGPGIPIGQTGLNLTKFSGGLSNLDQPSQITVTGSMTVTYGKKVSVAGTDYAIFDATGTFTITPDSLNLSAQVNLVGGILGQGNGEVDINWKTGVYTLRVNAELMHVFTFNGSLAFDNSGNITLDAKAGVKVPDVVPIIGGQQLVSANVYLQIRPELGDPDQNFIAAWVTTDLGPLGKPTAGFRMTFDGRTNYLSQPPQKTVQADALLGIPESGFPNLSAGSYTVGGESGVESYEITVTDKRFASSTYDGSRDFFLLMDKTPPAGGKAVFTLGGNSQNTLNQIDSNFAGSPIFAYAVSPTAKVPHESGQIGQPGGAPDQRVFIVPRRFFLDGPSSTTLVPGTIGFGIYSKDDLSGANKPTFSIVPRYTRATAVAADTTLDASGTATITVTGVAFGPNVNKTTVDVFYRDIDNPTVTGYATSIVLNPSNPAHNYNQSTGAFSVPVTWNGLRDLATFDRTNGAYTFVATINDGANSLSNPPPNVYPNALTTPNPVATITLMQPDGNVPDVFNPTPFLRTYPVFQTPNEATTPLNIGGPNLVFNSTLALKTTVTVKAGFGGFIGTGGPAAILAAGKTLLTSGVYNSPAEAAAFVTGLQFVANSKYTGESSITVTVTTTTLTGKKYSRDLVIPVLQNPFFLDQSQGVDLNNDGFFGREGQPFIPVKLQFAAPGFSGVGPYTWKVVNGDLHGLTISDTGIISGTPTSTTLPLGAYQPETITIAAYDSRGHAATMRYFLKIAQNLGSFSPNPQNDTLNVDMRFSESHVRLFPLANDLIPGGTSVGSLFVEIVSGPSHGTIELPFDKLGGVSQAAIDYTPVAGYVGPDSFTYRITQDGENRTATVAINVTPMIVDDLSTETDSNVNFPRLSLYQAIHFSNTIPGKQTIAFSPDLFNTPRTITLDKTALFLSDDVTITGPGANLLTIDGNGDIGEGVFLNGVDQNGNINSGITTVIDGLTITNGRRNVGAGIVNLANLTLSNSVVTGNTTVAANGKGPSYGGGIYNYLGTLNIVNCTISGNAGSEGGGIANIFGQMTVTNSTISNNSTFATKTFGSGGGIFNNAGTVNLTNVTVSNNSAAESGGGIANFGVMTIRNSTIVLNTADTDQSGDVDHGGGISTGDTAVTTTIFNTIIAGNSVDASPGNALSATRDDISGFTPIDASSAFNLIGDPGTAGGLVHGALGNILGSGGQPLPIDAIIDRRLKDNGGRTPTHALVTSGPAVNAGSNAKLDGATVKDQRGGPRVAGGVVDIGAVEFDSDTLGLISINDSDTDNTLLVNEAVTYTLTFNRDIDAGTLSSADFKNLGTAAVTIGSVTETAPGVVRVVVTPVTLGTMLLQIPSTADIRDTTGQALAVPQQDNDTLTVTGAALPITLVSVTDSDADNTLRVNQPVTFTFTFNREVSLASVTAADFTNSGTASIIFGSITHPSPGVVSVLVTPTSVGTLSVRIPAGAIITDTVGTVLTGPHPAVETITVTDGPIGPALEAEFSVGPDRGSNGLITLRNPDNSARYTLAPFGTSFTGGIRTASGDFNGDGVADLVCASGPGMPGTIRVYDGVTQKAIALPETVAGGGLPFGNTFLKGIIVAAGDLNADGLSDLIITAEAGGGARVRIFQSTGSGFIQRSDFIALIGGDNKPDAVKFRGGSRATVSDINGDGTGDLIWAAGAGGGPRIATFDGKRLDQGSNVFYKLTGDFFALGTNLRDGAYVAGGDVDGDGIGDLIAGGGSGAPPQVVGFSGKNLMTNNFSKFLDFQFGANSRQGIRVAVKDVNADGQADVIVGSAPGAGSRVTAFDGKNLSGSNTGNALFDFNAIPNFTGGVFVG